MSTTTSNSAALIPSPAKGEFTIVENETGIVLLTTKHLGVAKVFQEFYNSRGSEFDLETGAWADPGAK